MADLGEGPWIPILFEVKKEKTTEGKKICHASQKKLKIWIYHWVHKVDTEGASSFKCSQLLFDMCMLKTAKC